MRIVCTRACRDLLAHVDAPDLASGRRVDANERAVIRRRIDRRGRNRRCEPCSRFADADLPVELRRDLGGQRRQRSGLVALAEEPAKRWRRYFRQRIRPRCQRRRASGNRGGRKDRHRQSFCPWPDCETCGVEKAHGFATVAGAGAAGTAGACAAGPDAAGGAVGPPTASSFT